MIREVGGPGWPRPHRVKYTRVRRRAVNGLELYLGGARSGKSALAERQALASGLQPVYVATAEAGDEEMAARIDHHRRRRDAGWQTVEEPLALADCLTRLARPDRQLVVDCLTLWATNLLLAGESHWQRERQALLDCLGGLAGPVLLVSNEVGQGVVPADPLSRRFVDEMGRLHQALARRCGRVVWVVAGLPQVVKGPALQAM